MPPIRVNLEAISGCCDYFLVLNCIILSICHANVPLCLPRWCWYRHFLNILSSYLFSPYFETIVHLSIYYDLYILIDVVWQSRYRYDLSVEEAAELARRAIYHATFRDGASGGVASGIPLSKCLLFVILICVVLQILSDSVFWMCHWSVYYVGPNGWKKLSGDDVGELHYNYYPVTPSTVDQEMAEVTVAWWSHIDMSRLRYSLPMHLF